jgi:hypothetical protein
VTILLVAIGGALGSVARYLFSSFVLRLSSSLSPVGTLAVNIVGCIAFGVIIGAAQQRLVLTPAAKGFLLIGVLGGFTTRRQAAPHLHRRKPITGTASRSTKRSCSKRASAGWPARP